MPIAPSSPEPGPGATASGLVLSGVTVAYGDVLALDAVDLTVAPATSLALMGPNGAGKTTLLDVAAGLRQPTRGRVTRPPGPVSYVVQEASHRWMPITVGEALDLVLPRRERRRPAGRRAIAEAAERLGVAHLRNRPFHELSGGERQRVRVAQALIRRPALLLLDEPVTGLDPPTQERILEIVAEETHRGAVVVVSTHHLDEARHCDRVALLARHLVAVGPPADVLEPASLRAAFGDRTLGRHAHHEHDHGLLVLDDHGHGHDHGDHRTPPVPSGGIAGRVLRSPGDET
ncbi:MAG: metal ABC transporter ATP-binding protein [Actinomyces sp.]|nr:MAG: metal ABC transporter ATP-binding protein [Actinomyces sp.]